MRNHDRASNADGDAFGSVAEARAIQIPILTRRWSVIWERQRLLIHAPYLGENECRLL